MAKDNADKPSFDVYGMLLLLGFLMTLGSTLLLNDELTTNWGFKLGGDAPPAQPWHITQYRDLTKNYSPNAPYIDIRKKDLDEWKVARNKTGAVNGSTFPVKDFEWPAGYKANEYAVDPLSPNNWESVQPNTSDDATVAKEKAARLEQFNLLLNSVPKDVPVEAPKEPAKTEAEAKKDETAAPKTDAAAPTTTEKKDETKKEEPKKDEAAAPKTDATAAPKTDSAVPATTEKKEEVK
ncbi:MAG: hypothetical protein WCT04_03675 [Planctomycetota bacterium]